MKILITELNIQFNNDTQPELITTLNSLFWQIYIQFLNSIKKEFLENFGNSDVSNPRNQEFSMLILSIRTQIIMSQTSSPIKQEQSNLQPQEKSFIKLILITINASLSCFIFGYTVTYLATIQYSTLKLTYCIPDSYSEGIALGILNGIVPIGGSFGALSTSVLLRCFSRKNIFLVLNLLNSLAIMTFAVSSLNALMIGRFLEGFCAGAFVAITPLYVSQILPPSLKHYGTLTQIMMSIGMSFSFFLKYILSFYLSPQEQWHFIAVFQYAILLPQSLVFLFIYPYNTPTYYFNLKMFKQGRQLMQNLYSSNYISKFVKLSNINSNQFTMCQLKQDDTPEIHIQNINEQAMVQRKDTPKAIFAALHVAFLQQMVGVSAIGVFCMNIFQNVYEDSAEIMSVFLNLLPGITSILTTKLLTKYGRKTLLNLGSASMGVLLLLCASGFMLMPYNKTLSQLLIIITLFLYRADYGLTVGPVTWLYIPQIITAKWVPVAIFLNWFGASLNMILFPIIVINYCNNNPKFLFIFWAVYTLLSLVINSQVFVETKDKTFLEVQLQYQKKYQKEKNSNIIIKIKPKKYAKVPKELKKARYDEMNQRTSTLQEVTFDNGEVALPIQYFEN